MWLLILLIIVGSIYFLSMQGITCCNSGSTYALVKSLVEDRKLEINKYIKLTKFLDYANVNKKYYTDRPPGLAFTATPFYAIGLNVTLVCVIAGTLSSALVYLISMHLVKNPLISFATALIFAFCTLNWRYSTIFIMHPLSTFLILISVYFFLLGYPIFLIGLILGLSTFFEYTDFVYFFGIGLTELITGNFSKILPLSIGFFIGVIPILAYNKRCFGSPLTTSYKYSAHFKWSNSFKTTFITPISEGIKGLLFYIKNKNGIKIPGGILLVSPVLIFGIIGFLYMPFELLILFLSITLPLFLLISKHKTYWAGGAGDYRYLSSMIPYITIPISLTLNNLTFLWPIVLILALISLAMVILKMVILTISINDLNKIEPDLIKKIKSGNFSFLNLNAMGKFIAVIFDTLFIRKKRLEKTMGN
ncbi:MAG: hypothetical protein ACOYT4_01370 [Nanoarchaeota archaeon]